MRICEHNSPARCFNTRGEDYTISITLIGILEQLDENERLGRSSAYNVEFLCKSAWIKPNNWYNLHTHTDRLLGIVKRLPVLTAKYIGDRSLKRDTIDGFLLNVADARHNFKGCRSYPPHVSGHLYRTVINLASECHHLLTLRLEQLGVNDR